MTLAFYECEEVADEFNGLRRIFAEQPELLAGDFAVLLEPTDAWVEAGCQGVIVLEAQFDGERAHTARPWMGTQRHPPRRRGAGPPRRARVRPVVVDGLEYRESLQVVRVEGGIAGKHNVVPDSCTLVVGRRFAPCYSAADAEAQVRALLDGRRRGRGAAVAPGALPNLTNPLVAEFVDGLGLVGAPEAGLDRRGPLRVARRARRSTSVPATPRSRTPRASS